MLSAVAIDLHPSLNIDDPRVALKLKLLDQAMPAESAIVFGDVYVVEGAYTQYAHDLGCERTVLVDSLETPGWLQTRLGRPNLDFYKGDFSDALFMKSIRERFDISVVYDILLHQPPLLHTIHLMLELTASKILICQPVLKEREVPNTLVYLPGNPDPALYPLAEQSVEYKAFDVKGVNQSNWIWGMTPSLLKSVLAGEGFEVTHEEDCVDMGNPAWMWWGCIAERREEGNPQHWSQTRPIAGLHTPDWVAAP
jgi:hypothetical protein